jgi:hypothetical protein
MPSLCGFIHRLANLNLYKIINAHTTAFTNAVRSAQIVPPKREQGVYDSVIEFVASYLPYDAFSTLQPFMIVPFEVSSAAPTRNFE